MRRLVSLLLLIPVYAFGQITTSPSGSGGVSNPNTSNVTFSDPTKTLLLGAASNPDLSGMVGGTGSATPQFLISTRNTNPGPADVNTPFLIVGDYRSGVSGDRYFMSVGKDVGLYLNAYEDVNGNGVSNHSPGAYMLHVNGDVTYAIVSENGGSQPSHLYTGVGVPANGGTQSVVFDVDSLGNTQLLNPFGAFGAINNTKPQLVLGNIADTSAPAWTYSSMYERAGTLNIGRYNNSTFVQGQELQITSGVVKVNGYLTLSGATGGAPTSLSRDSDGFLHFGNGDGGGTVFNNSTNTINAFFISDSGGININKGHGDPGSGNIAMLGKITTYNNISTQGNGVPSIVKVGRVTSQSAANASITTYTTPASDGSYEVSMNMNVTAATAISASLNCTYTDEANVSRTMIFPVTGLTGAFLAGGLATATGAYESPVMHIRCKASTAITLFTAGSTYTGVTYTAEGIIKQTQ